MPVLGGYKHGVNYVSGILSYKCMQLLYQDNPFHTGLLEVLIAFDKKLKLLSQVCQQ